jgi:hypothetical protein
VKCERCLEAGVVFEMEAVASSSTLLPTAIFRDDQGKDHRHDPNLIITTHVCPAGHVWKETESRPCWCGWREATA